jgi:hypothetical protein
MGLPIFETFTRFLKKPRLENLKIEASLFLILDPLKTKSHSYILEIRIENMENFPATVQTIVCETNDKTIFAGLEKVYFTEGNPQQGFKLGKKGDVVHENFELAIASAAQFEAARPSVMVTTKTGMVFQAEMDKKSLGEIIEYENSRGIK